jgi:TolB-like protein
MDAQLIAPAASAGLIDSSKAPDSKRQLIEWSRAKFIAVAAAAFIGLAVAASAYHSVSRKSNAAINSLAVLPFINVNADQQLDYLSDGMTETLIYNLSQLPNLSVKARSSVFRYKGSDVTPRTVGAELNVQAVLSGRIAQRGELFTLSLELADARTENVIWSEQYRRKQTELVSLQSEIARDVSRKLRVKLAGADEQKLWKSDTTVEEAYHLYLEGRYHWNKRTLIDLEKAPGYFNGAISLDPNYALAYAGLADTYALLPFYREEPLREAMLPAREAATKALRLDNKLGEAHAALGLVNTCEFNFTEAESEFKTAIELNPNYAMAHTWYGVMLSYMGRHGEALVEFQRALEIDPLSLICNVKYGEGLFYARRYDEAIGQLGKAIELDADFERAHCALFAVCQAKGSYSKALEEYAKDRELTGEPQTAALARDVFARSGWQGFLRAMTGRESPSSVSRRNLVEFLAALGERDKAFAELSKSYEIFGPLLRVDPLLDPLRDDPRFAEILRRAGLQQG